jgi:hypothetical protein
MQQIVHFPHFILSPVYFTAFLQYLLQNPAIKKYLIEVPTSKTAKWINHAELLY